MTTSCWLTRIRRQPRRIRRLPTPSCQLCRQEATYPARWAAEVGAKVIARKWMSCCWIRIRIVISIRGLMRYRIIWAMVAMPLAMICLALSHQKVLANSCSLTTMITSCTTTTTTVAWATTTTWATTAADSPASWT